MNRLRSYAPHIYYFFFFSAAAVYAPFLAYWLKEAGLTGQQIGIIYSIGPFVALFVQPLWGTICDRYGLEKAALMICCLLTPLIAFGYSTGGGFAVYAATAALLAFFSSPMVPLADAIAVNHAHKHGQTYGGARVWGSIGFALVVTPVGMLYQQIGVRHMFAFYMLMMVVAFGAAALLERGGVRRSVAWGDIRRLLANKQFFVFLVLVFAVACGSQSYSVFYSVYLGYAGDNVSENIGLLSMVSAASELPFFVYAKRLVERFGYRRIMALCALLGAVRLFVFSLYPPFPVLLVNQLLQGVTYALFYAAGVQFAYGISPGGLKTTGQTIFSMVYVNLSILTASNGGGWLIDQAGFGLLFRIAAASSLLGAVGFAAYGLITRSAGQRGRSEAL